MIAQEFLAIEWPTLSATMHHCPVCLSPLHGRHQGKRQRSQDLPHIMGRCVQNDYGRCTRKSRIVHNRKTVNGYDQVLYHASHIFRCHRLQVYKRAILSCKGSSGLHWILHWAVVRVEFFCLQTSLYFCHFYVLCTVYKILAVTIYKNKRI